MKKPSSIIDEGFFYLTISDYSEVNNICSIASWKFSNG